MASFCGLFGRLIAQIMIVRMLGPDGVSRIAYMVWPIEVANVFSNFGLPTSLTRYLAQLHGQKKTQLAASFAQWVFVRYLVLALLGSVAVGVAFFRWSQYAGAESVLPVLTVLFWHISMLPRPEGLRKECSIENRDVFSGNC